MITFKQAHSDILTEIRIALSDIDESEVNALGNAIFKAHNIVGIGAGRVGMAMKAFIMRLGHMGFKAWFLGDTTVPGLKKNDLLLVASGSGETKTILDLVEISHNNKIKIALITGNRNSSMARLAETIVVLNAPSATKEAHGIKSIQPMTTLNEQSLGIFFDAVVLMMMEGLDENHESMWNRHSNLE
jgi:6-phospho-3-hexuloisomerase